MVGPTTRTSLQRYKTKSRSLPHPRGLFCQLCSPGGIKGVIIALIKRQFALVQSSTRTRIDLGLKFNDRPVGGRLESSGPFGTMCTHRIQLTDISQVDEELLELIEEAYHEAR